MKRENRLIAIVAMAAIASVFLFSHEEAMKMSWLRFGLVLTVLAVISVLPFIIKKMVPFREEIWSYTLTGSAVLILIQVTNYLRLSPDKDTNMLLTGTYVIGIVGMILFLYIAWSEKTIGESHILWLIFLAFMLRLFCGVLTQAHYFQNDVYNFAENEWGHLGYVYRIFATGKILDINPVGHNQLYHPPLHHIILALGARLFQLLGMDMANVDEYLQAFALFYTTVTLVYLNKIGRAIHVCPFGRFVMIGLAGFLPYGYLMAGALNNDPLVTMLMMMAVYYTIVWYQDPTWKRILAMAVCIGCAMMSKVSGALVAPAMAVVMLAKAWQMRREWRIVCKQFVCFGCIAFPLGLWHSLAANIMYGMRLGYVPQLSKEYAQYIGQISMADRFLNFNNAFDKICVQWGTVGIADYNIFTTLWKYVVFGEATFYDNNSVVRQVSTYAFLLTGILLAALVIGSVIYLFSRKNHHIYKVLLWGSVLVIGFMYVKFCISHPFVCTMNVRYIMSAMYCAMIMLGAVLGSGYDRREKAGKKVYVYRGVVLIFTAVYMIVSFLVYWNLQMII